MNNIKLGNKYLGIRTQQGSVLFTYVYLFGWDVRFWQDSTSVPFTWRKNGINRLWWGTLVILWDKVI